MLWVEKRKDISPSLDMKQFFSSYLPFTTFGRIGFKSWGILTVGPFVLRFFFFFFSFLCLFFSCLHPQGWPMNRQVFTRTTAVLYDQRASMWICVSPHELLAGRTGPMGSVKTDETLNQPLWLKTSLISAQPQLTVFPSYSDEPEKPKSDEEVVCTCFFVFRWDRDWKVSTCGFG